MLGGYLQHSPYAIVSYVVDLISYLLFAKYQYSLSRWTTHLLVNTYTWFPYVRIRITCVSDKWNVILFRDISPLSFFKYFISPAGNSCQYTYFLLQNTFWFVYQRISDYRPEVYVPLARTRLCNLHWFLHLKENTLHWLFGSLTIICVFER